MWRGATQHFEIEIRTITENIICTLISIRSYSTLHRSVHSHSNLIIKCGGQISLEVTGKRRKNGIPASYAFYRKRPSKIKNLIQLIRGKRIKRICGICRCVDSVSVLKDFDSCLSVSNLSFVTCEHLFVISGCIMRSGSGLCSFWRGLRCIVVRDIEVLSRSFYCNFGLAEEYRSFYRRLCHRDIRKIYCSTIGKYEI